VAHMNEAAKQARCCMFAMIAKFGVPAVFFTVTPNDSGSFQIKVNALKETEAPPNIDAYLMRLKLTRVLLPCSVKSILACAHSVLRAANHRVPHRAG